MDERETSKIIKFIEYNKNKLTSGNSDSEISWGKLMIYDVLTTKPREAIDHLLIGDYGILLTDCFLLRL